jgi:hypothetical protein
MDVHLYVIGVHLSRSCHGVQRQFHLSEPPEHRHVFIPAPGNIGVVKRQAKILPLKDKNAIPPSVVSVSVA